MALSSCTFLLAASMGLTPCSLSNSFTIYERHMLPLSANWLNSLILWVCIPVSSFPNILAGSWSTSVSSEFTTIQKGERLKCFSNSGTHKGWQVTHLPMHLVGMTLFSLRLLWKIAVCPRALPSSFLCDGNGSCNLHRWSRPSPCKDLPMMAIPWTMSPWSYNQTWFPSCNPAEFTWDCSETSYCRWSPSDVNRCNDGCHADIPWGLPHNGS